MVPWPGICVMVYVNDVLSGSVAGSVFVTPVFVGVVNESPPATGVSLTGVTVIVTVAGADVLVPSDTVNFSES
jgi:hypothetical protein